MPSANLPPITFEYRKLRLRSVEGPLVTLDLPATDHRIIIGKHCDYLIGNGMAHAVSKKGLYILSGPVPTMLKDLHTVGDATSEDGYIGPIPKG